MKNIRCLLITLFIMCFTVNCYANQTILKSSPDYSGIEKQKINLELRNEYTVNYTEKIFSDVKHQYERPSWCQIRSKKELNELENILGINMDYENFNDKWLFISFGVKINELEYWSEYKNYLYFDGSYQPVIDAEQIFNSNKVYVYKMDKLKLMENSSHYASISNIVRNNEYKVNTTNNESYEIVEINCIKEGKLSKSYLFDYRYLKDKNNNLPQFGLYNQVSSNYGYELLKDRYGMPEFRYNNYKNKCIIVSFGAKLKGFKVYSDRVEGIPTGEYVENGCFIYETDYLDFEIKQGIFAVDEKTRNMMSDYLFE